MAGKRYYGADVARSTGPHPDPLTDAVQNLRAKMEDFESFLNEPPAYEDRRMVREYRHEAYCKWREMRDQIIELIGTA